MTRFGPQPNESIKSLSDQSVRGCLEDAGAEASQVAAVYFSSAGQGFIEDQVSIPGQIALQGTALEGLPVIHVEHGCANASTAFWLARNHLLSGPGDLVLAVGTEKMSLKHMQPSERGSQFIHLYSSLCRAHMERFGTTQRQLAMIASKNHANSVRNSKCHNNRPFTVDEVLDARLIAYPLTSPMYSSLSDGSAAVLLATAYGLKKLKGANKAIRVDSCILTSGRYHSLDDFENHFVSRAASRAYAQAGIGPEDVDIAEVHDATSFDELFLTELLGFCELGDGGRFAQSGATMLNGRLPVNPSGGLVSKGHPIRATGLGQIYELVTQLRQKAGPRQVDYAKVAVQENGGGWPGVEEGTAVVTVLSR